jgi:hypothetical protein
MPCAFILSHATANGILDQSTSASYDVWVEWILLAMKDNIPITTKKVDWLAYQQPYWEHIEPDAMKREREISREETIKRIRMNAPVAFTMIEERFRDVTSMDS